MDRPYDLFERFPDGKFLWHGAIVGREKALQALEKLAQKCCNEVFAAHVPTREIIATLNEK